MTVIPRRHILATSSLLSDLAPANARLVRYLRLWNKGEAGVSRLCEELVVHLGPAKGERVTEIWCALCDLFVRYGHRPLTPRPDGSIVITCDEAGFAHFVTLAAEMRREDAMFAALMMVRADIAPLVTSLATQVGLSIKQADLRAQSAPCPATHNGTTSLQ